MHDSIPNSILDTSKIQELYKRALMHVQHHDCSAHPYKYGERFVYIIQNHSPRTMLEIGTGFGFSTVLMAAATPLASVETIEKDPAHMLTAKEFFEQQKVAGRISCIEGIAEEILPQLKKQYDLIFFDGYGIHYEFLAQYHRLLMPNGIAVIANNHLSSKTSEHFFEELHDGEWWEILDQFGDTTVARKK